MSSASPFDPERLREELAAFRAKVEDGLAGLSESDHHGQGCSEREALFQDDPITLYRYQPLVTQEKRVPILFVYALVNRPYILDLEPDRSLIRQLLLAGHPVYLIDWGYPKRYHRYLGLDDYIDDYIHRCVEQVCEHHAVDGLNLLGVCQGGTLALCYGALHPERIRNLITMITPVDFHTEDNRLSQWGRQIDIDLLVDTYGNIPGTILNRVYLALKPFSLLAKKYSDFAAIADNPEQVANFYRMERWLWDCPDQAGEAFRQFVQGCFQRNELINGKLKIGDATVDLKRLEMPLLNIYATADHIVPPSASIPLGQYVSSTDYHEHPFKGGHIGIYVSRRAQIEIPQAIDDWLSSR